MTGRTMTTPETAGVGDPGPRHDRGSTMLIALVLVVVLGSVAAALATYASVGLREAVVMRDRADLRASAEGGLRFGIERLRLGQTLCDSAVAGGGGAPVPVPAMLNGRSVSLTCTATANTTANANAWAAIVTGIGTSAGTPAFVSLGASTKKITGPLYLAQPARTDLKAPISLIDGDLWYPDATCAAPTPPAVPNLTITPSPPRGTICTTSTWDQIAPAPTLPPLPTVVDPPGRNDLDGLANCRVFFPGVYTSPPALDHENYFVSGNYYFSNFGQFDIGHAVVLGGRPGGAALGETPSVMSAPNCTTALSNPVVIAAEAASGTTDKERTGVTWILGGNSSINVGVQGELELFRRLQGQHVVSLVAVGTSGSGYTASTLTATGTPLLSTKAGNSNDVVIHGMVYAPTAAIEFGNVSNSANGQMQGGLVVARLELQSSASASGLVVGVNAVPRNPTFVLTATAVPASGGNVQVRAVVQMSATRQVAVNSWRVL